MENTLTLETLEQTYGINYAKIKGYQTLEDRHQAIFKSFLPNLFAAHGADARATIKPKSIYFTEEMPLYIKEGEGKEYTCVGSSTYALNLNGDKTLLKKYVELDYKKSKLYRGKGKKYLRFEYTCHGRNTWLHVISEKEWY